MRPLCGVSPIEYSSGRRRTRRLNYGGDRQANAALHRIVFTRLRHDPRTQAYYERRTQEGKTRREIIRGLSDTQPVRSSDRFPASRVIGASVRRERVWGVSETPSNTLQYRFDGPEDAPVLILPRSLAGDHLAQVVETVQVRLCQSNEGVELQVRASWSGWV
ncbi:MULTISPECIES: IS110 family transposase [unclassified Streptomyces]|uniref:IS110 family transposase n=1 Tax=Streptomyces sp. Ag82_O1-12 TaxID=1938854 RepID=UPI00211C9DDC|nr:MULTISPECIES: IS110 family transposase [unclassified Streptomyces]